MARKPRFSYKRKSVKFVYYLTESLHMFTPGAFFRFRRKRLLEQIQRREDKDCILARAGYYNKLSQETPLPADAKVVGRYHVLRERHMRVYVFDASHYLKYFNPRLRFLTLPGDITHIPDYPSLTKSRPIEGDNQNSVVLLMDKPRHFIFVNDPVPFRKKKDIILFRGETDGKPHRQRFLDMYQDHPMCDLGETNLNKPKVRKYYRKPLTRRQHLDYKFIVSLEGVDVASNLKWVMSSNSIAVMPRPKYETWFMEGTLKPDYHYIEIKPDYSDLIEKCSYYIAHPEEAEKIIAHAHEYVSQFLDRKREKLVSLLVLDKYFRMTGQAEQE